MKRIEERLAKLKLSASAVSRRATGSPDTIRSWANNPERSPRVDTLAKIAAELQTTPEWLLGRTSKADADIPDAPQPTGQTEAAPKLPARASMPADIEVLGTAAGSLLSGAFQIEGVIDYVRRPPALAGARDIYALYIEGSSMEPRYFPGDLVYVNPHKPPRIGDVVIVQEVNGGPNVITASIGVLHKRGNGAVVLAKYNPPDSQITIAGDRVAAIHRVLTTNELFGV
ncbi:LexA family transcriptional regulator [Hoeflea sp.]|uniref:LexA family transcriptional regulator n=1 Tax=Hoeflea sp. TaxID=1940281 RepID=UPI00374984C6